MKNRCISPLSKFTFYRLAALLFNCLALHSVTKTISKQCHINCNTGKMCNIYTSVCLRIFHRTVNDSSADFLSDELLLYDNGTSRPFAEDHHHHTQAIMSTTLDIIKLILYCSNSALILYCSIMCDLQATQVATGLIFTRGNVMLS